MIKKIILITSIIFFTYSAILKIRKPPFVCQSMWQTNVARTQDFIFENSIRKYVIVGSSLAGTSLSSIHSEDYYDLSFGGATLYDGLELMKKSRVIPRVIFIEANYFHNVSYGLMDLNKTTFLPIMFDLKKNIPALQEKYQPMNVLLPFVFMKIQGIKMKYENISNDKKAGPAIVKKPHETSRERSVFEEMLKMQVKTYNRIPAKKTMDASSNKLEEYIEYFKKRGVKIVFFEMPVDKSLCSAPFAEYLRTRLRKQFKPGDYDYIPMPDCSLFNTGDGIHLDNQSAITYKEYFLKEADKIIRKVR
jgi:hypothetical protein